jgi:Putative endonuclease segE, GIY-YIG domain
MSDWIYNGESFLTAPETAFGFIYCITNTITGQKYIGKKQIWSHLTKKVPGKKNRKHYTKEAKWRDYWSSCDELKEDIKREGQDKFVREIVKLCETKGQLTFSEVEHQIKQDVLTARLPNGEFAFYNQNVMNRWFRSAK